MKFDDIDNFNDIYSLSTLISMCDFVITISNSTAHLAGAVNKKTYLLLPKGKGRYWYWSKYKNNCVWYPSINIIEQSVTGNWGNVLNELKSKIIVEINKE